MRKTYAEPRKEWSGFKPVAYTVSDAWGLPLKQACGDGTEIQSKDTTVGEVLIALRDQQIRAVDPVFDCVKVTTDAGILTLTGSSFNVDFADVLVGLLKDGINFHETRWFYYDRDHAIDDLMASYTFFVVHKKSIVREQVGFCDCSGSGFDPSIFKANEDERPVWRNHSEWDAAWVRYWYRKFYT